MLDINNIFLFIYIFSWLVCTKEIIKLLRSIFSTPPKPLIYSNLEVIYLGLSISYIITYLLN